jgi:hypothetical protein
VYDIEGFLHITWERAFDRRLYRVVTLADPLAIGGEPTALIQGDRIQRVDTQHGRDVRPCLRQPAEVSADGGPKAARRELVPIATDDVVQQPDRG